MKDANEKYDFSKLTPEQKAFIYGTIAPDGKFTEKLGLQPNGDYVDNWHYFDPQERVKAIFERAEKNIDDKGTIDYAFGYGTMSHATGDWLIHPNLPQARQITSKEVLGPNLEYLRERGFYWQHVLVEREFDHNTLLRQIKEKYGQRINVSAPASALL
jgi:hypothetical protein